MQIDKHTLYPTMFILGHRINNSGVPEKIGTVIVKGTFQALDTPVVMSKGDQVPIFLKDVPFNFVRNSDFEGDKLKPWQTRGGIAILEGGGVNKSKKAVEFTSNTETDCLAQELTFDEPIGGRTFIFSFYGKSELPITINGFLLRAKSGDTICNHSAPMTTDFDRFTSAVETWSTNESSTEIEIVMPGSGDPANPVYFDQVQVEETETVTRWDEDTVFRYEHDLVPFKPNADVIVLGAARPPDGSCSGTWYEVLESNTELHVEKEYVATDIKTFPTKTIFGWAQRGSKPRKSQAGYDVQNFDPNTMVLPKDFKNEFYNGYDRSLTEDVPLPYLDDGVVLTIRSERRQPNPPEPVSFNVQLPASRPSAALTMIDDTGQEIEQLIPLLLDTVIIEPDMERYFVVWRGSWLFDDQNRDRYIKLSVSGGI